jgi:hypothetical protein
MTCIGFFITLLNRTEAVYIQVLNCSILVQPLTRLGPAANLSVPLELMGLRYVWH